MSHLHMSDEGGRAFAHTMTRAIGKSKKQVRETWLTFWTTSWMGMMGLKFWHRHVPWSKSGK